MPIFEDYREKAAACLRLAQDTEHAGNTALLLDMAQAWLKLAEQEAARLGRPPAVSGAVILPPSPSATAAD